ncbi:hypothetical protein C8R45DRAFT_1183674 [Mycena sanguinolenta]|nr:hypothetical protein C8R45DRAFT_1183674 [Mycena sanguinolenta]
MSKETLSNTRGRGRRGNAVTSRQEDEKNRNTKETRQTQPRTPIEKNVEETERTENTTHQGKLNDKRDKAPRLTTTKTKRSDEETGNAENKKSGVRRETNANRVNPWPGYMQDAELADDEKGSGGVGAEVRGESDWWEGLDANQRIRRYQFSKRAKRKESGHFDKISRGKGRGGLVAVESRGAKVRRGTQTTQTGRATPTQGGGGNNGKDDKLTQHARGDDEGGLGNAPASVRLAVSVVVVLRGSLFGVDTAATERSVPRVVHLLLQNRGVDCAALQHVLEAPELRGERASVNGASCSVASLGGTSSQQRETLNVSASSFRSASALYWRTQSGAAGDNAAVLLDGTDERRAGEPSAEDDEAIGAGDGEAYFRGS